MDSLNVDGREALLPLEYGVSTELQKFQLLHQTITGSSQLKVEFAKALVTPMTFHLESLNVAGWLAAKCSGLKLIA